MDRRWHDLRSMILRGRGGGIRTPDPLLPKNGYGICTSLYQFRLSRIFTNLHLQFGRPYKPI
jgi:hypothetical protein